MKKTKDQLEADRIQEEKIIGHLNKISSTLQESTYLTQEYASKLDRHMNAYWKYATASDMHPHTKTNIAALINTIKATVKRLSNGK